MSQKVTKEQLHLHKDVNFELTSLACLFPYASILYHLRYRGVTLSDLRRLIQTLTSTSSFTTLTSCE